MPGWKRLVWWAPRVLSVAFAAFLSLFALDVFGEGRDVLATIAALAIHLIPVYVVLLTLWIAWQHEWAGTIVYAALAVAYIVTANPQFPWQTLAAISGPLFVMSVLFFASWLSRRSGERPSRAATR
jgi:hypothetical protein